MTRLLVSLAPRVELGENIEIHRDPVRVGVLRWSTRTPMMALVVRARHAIERGVLTPIEPGPWVVGRNGAAAPFPGPMFVPYKPGCDVVLRGSATVESRGPGLPTPAKITVGGRSVRLAVPGADVPAGTPARFELGRGLLLGPDGLPGVDAPPGSVEIADAPVLEPGHDYNRYHAATPGLRFDHPEDGTPIEIEGLTFPGDVLRFEMPRRRPRVLVDPAEAGSSLQVAGIHCDTIAIDVDARTVELVYRGNLELQESASEIEKIVVLVAREAESEADPELDYIEDLRELPRGQFFHATEMDDAERGQDPPALEPHELAMAQFDSWSPAAAPSPSIKLDRYVEIAAVLTEQRAPREEVLRGFGLTEYTWAVEERAWAELLATLPREGEEESGLHADYARLVAEHSKRHARPEESSVTPEDYGAILARMERVDPSKVMQEAGFGLGAWMRIDARMSALADADPEVEAAVERAAAAERDRLRSMPSSEGDAWEDDE